MEFAKKLIKSIDQNGSEFAKTSVFIFSDQPKVFNQLRVKNLELFSIKIPSYRWPDVANFRYKIFHDNRTLFENCDVLIYTDADQFVHQIPVKTINEIFKSKSLGLVEHSGFWRHYYKANWFKSLSRFQLKIEAFAVNRDLRQKIIKRISKKILSERNINGSSISLFILRLALLAIRPIATVKFLIGKVYFYLNRKKGSQTNNLEISSSSTGAVDNKPKEYLGTDIESNVEKILPIRLNLSFRFKLVWQVFQDPISYSQWNNYGNLLTHLNWKNRGTWETRNNLMAFTPARKRNQYFCGGVWLGEKNAFLLLCKTLAEWTELDLAAGYQAEWFDESYINAYAAFVPKFTSLPPNWNWSARYPWLSELDKYIELLEKPDVLPIPER